MSESFGMSAVMGNSVMGQIESVVKTCDAQIRFALLTGVSKFSRVSVFSDLNNLVDLTMDARYADMLGYTQEELERNFAPHIEHVAA